jgi:hypothetical protein
MPSDDQPPGASGCACRRCSGARPEHPERVGAAGAGRIGDTFSALERRIERCIVRNPALRRVDAPALAENAALARHLAAWARIRGDEQVARRLDEEAVAGDDAHTQVQALLDGLDTVEPDSTR